MTSSLLFLLCFVAAPWFSPNVRIHQERPGHACLVPAIAVGPGAPSRQPIYVVYEDDSMAGSVPVSADLMFQMSTDAGATWLAEDKHVRHGKTGLSPDVTTDPDGNIYIVYTGRDTSANSGHYYCVRSTDGGVTWCEPVQVDDNVTYLRNLQWARVATDSAGNLFCAWPEVRSEKSNIWSSVSTDRGTTWGASVRVGNDTTRDFYGFADVDVSVQPGTNQYLVAAVCRYRTSLSVEIGSYLYRSTDGGLSYQPGVRLDTFSGFVGHPRVVADRDHLICDYTGDGEASGNGRTESRTFYAGPDTWGSVAAVSDTMLNSYYHGGKLALSSDDRVHTALMVCDASQRYEIHYASSSDHGASWFGLTRVNDGGADFTQFPDIGVDSEGYVYVVWCDFRNHRNEIWFSTTKPAGIAEEPMQQPIVMQPSATVIRNDLFLPEAASPMPQAAGSLLDISGRQVMVLKPGANDVSRLAPGVYFVHSGLSVAGRQPSSVTKVVVTR